MTASLSIVTAARGASKQLHRCVASVADQDGVPSEHVLVLKAQVQGAVMPAGSYRTLLQETQGGGLYSALNQGLAATQGEVLAWLNDDEQYLPGTLAFVQRFFLEHPSVDLLFGDFLVLDTCGRLLSYRKGCPPRWPYILSAHQYLFSCALFFRRRIWDFGNHFDASYKCAGDMDFVAQVLRAGFCAAHVSRYVATFTWTGDNLGSSNLARTEEAQVRATAPSWVRRFRWPLNLMRLVEKACGGAYRQSWPLTYEVFLDDLTRRTSVTALSASWRWPQT